MDRPLQALAEFATDAARVADALTPQAQAALLDHLVDGLGCAVAAASSHVAQTARNLASRSVVTQAVGSGGASVIGLATLTTPELAAFANSSMTRHLDFNDSYSSRSGGHPSDMTPGVLAVAESASRSGSEVLEGVFVAYEVFGALSDAASLRDVGWDQGVFVAIATASGISRCLGLGVEQAANAISLAAVTSNHLRVARSGELTDWKGCATAHAVMNAVFVTRLAALGMTGPAEPFTGRDGLLDRVTNVLELAEPGTNSRSVVERSALKFLPIEGAAQAPAEVFMRLSREIRPDDVRSIEIHAYEFLVREIGGGRGDAAQKWDPTTRETADHSLPYILAVALTDGVVNVESFLPSRVADPALRPLMQKISVHEDPAARGAFPPGRPVRIRIELNDGRTLDERCEFFRGHPTRPPSPGDVDAKFDGNVVRALGADDGGRLRATLRGLADVVDIDDPARLLRAARVDGGNEPTP